MLNIFLSISSGWLFFVGGRDNGFETFISEAHEKKIKIKTICLNGIYKNKNYEFDDTSELILNFCFKLSITSHKVTIMTKENKKNRFYYNEDFLGSPQGRSMRILSEYYGPLKKITENKIHDTIVFFGSARIKSESEAIELLSNLNDDASDQDKKRAQKDVEMSRFYEDALQLSKKLTLWSKNLDNKKSRYIITSGGGGGIMEAANRGAKEANGISMGLTISLPFEATSNKYISEGLDLKFHYFFMRKFWFIYLAKALVVWPGGFGTLDEVMELLTLIQTEKIKKKLPIVLYGSEFWNNVVNWDYLVDCGTISKSDLDLFHISDDIDDSYEYITKYIESYKLKGPYF